MKPTSRENSHAGLTICFCMVLEAYFKVGVIWFWSLLPSIIFSFPHPCHLPCILPWITEWKEHIICSSVKKQFSVAIANFIQKATISAFSSPVHSSEVTYMSSEEFQDDTRFPTQGLLHWWQSSVSGLIYKHELHWMDPQFDAPSLVHCAVPTGCSTEIHWLDNSKAAGSIKILLGWHQWGISYKLYHVVVYHMVDRCR